MAADVRSARCRSNGEPRSGENRERSAPLRQGPDRVVSLMARYLCGGARAVLLFCGLNACGAHGTAQDGGRGSDGRSEVGWTSDTRAGDAPSAFDAAEGDARGVHRDAGPSDGARDLVVDAQGAESTYTCGSSTCSSSQYCVRSARAVAPPPGCQPVPPNGVCPVGTQSGCAGGQPGCGDLPGSGIGACRTSSCDDSTLCQCLCASIGNGQCSRDGQVINCFVP